MIDQSSAIDLCRSVMMIAILLAAPVMIVATVVGLLTGILQTLFQVQDQSISFVPKLIACTIVVVACMPWMFSRLIEFTQQTFLGSGF
ncbi:flagellar biosynthetic protein FliQ [Stieleria varia]|uniref:Flagellar biosynthetic protein FliQ n=1 Tax=Stieleria varia TaxID=2528005 RepID=A0A5C6AJF5_9BACT|nr:flagellar biosynthetic protein FliQ [Stieleria varia]TWT98333.1 Flagellar biosynthetic protein FliQ [Stieleria varia]